MKAKGYTKKHLIEKQREPQTKKIAPSSNPKKSNQDHNYKSN